MSNVKAKEKNTAVDLSNFPKEASVENLPALFEPQSIATGSQRIVDVLNLTPEQIQVAKAYAEQFDWSDTNAVLSFGRAPQEKYAQALKELLGGMRAKDMGGVGYITAKLVKGVNLVDLPGLKAELLAPAPPKKSFWDKITETVNSIPVIGGSASKGMTAIDRFYQNQKSIESLIDEIESDIKNQMRGIVVENTRLDNLIKFVESNFYDLGIMIYAGELVMENGFEKLKNMRDEAISTSDPVLIGKVNLFKEQIASLDQRLLRMKTSYTAAPVKLQKILTVQQAGRITLQNLSNQLIFDVPKFLEATITLVAGLRIKDAQEGAKEREALGDLLDELSGDVTEKIAHDARKGQLAGVRQVQQLEEDSKRLVELIKTLSEEDAKTKEAFKQSENLLLDVSRSYQKGLEEATQI